MNTLNLGESLYANHINLFNSHNYHLQYYSCHFTDEEIKSGRENLLRSCSQQRVPSAFNLIQPDLLTHLLTHCICRAETFPFFSSRLFGYSSHEVAIRQTDKRKTNFVHVGAPKTDRYLGFIYHPELRRKGPSLGLQRDENNSQEVERNRYLINQWLPCLAGSLSDIKCHLW